MNIALRQHTLDTSAIEIRLATLDDIPALMPVLEEFFHATPWSERGLTFQHDKVENALRLVIGRGVQPYLLALDRGEIVGCLSWHYWSDFCEPIAVMDETYIKPEYRRSDLARKLVRLSMFIAQGDNARVMNFPLASGLKETRTFVNMLRKFGCEMTGVMMTKVL